MKILTLSGWGQPYDALADLLPEATHMEYAHHEAIDQALDSIADTGQGYDVIIGWSLGGQLAARAIAAGKIKPKKLVLLATPFQFVEIGKNGIGMKRDTFEIFYHNFMKNPARTLNKAWDLVHYMDTQAKFIKDQLSTFSKDAVLTRNWLNWLALINGYSCKELDFQSFPPTLIVHGTRDAVVGVEQAECFVKHIASARLEIWQDCGHAPHWHDRNRLRSLIMEHTGV